MGRWISKEQHARRDRWRQQHLPRVRQTARPNATYITEPQVLAVLQQLADGVTQVLMARPLAPFPWLADYLRHACKVAYAIEQDAAVVLMTEMHKKRRVIQNALLDTKADERESKRLIRAITMQQDALSLPTEELRLTGDDYAFLMMQIPSHQSQWSVDVTAMELPPPSEAVNDWLQTQQSACRHIEPYTEMVMRGVTQALIDLELTGPENAAEWIVGFFQQFQQRSSANAAELTLYFKTNYELMRKIDSIKQNQREMHLRREALEDIHTQLNGEIAMRRKFIDTLRVANLTVRTHAIMDGTPLFLNSQKQWILPGCLLLPHTLPPQEVQALQRAERFLMEEDELRWRFLLTSQLRYDAAVTLQAAWRRSHSLRVYRTLVNRRRHAATVIQRNYFHYLYHRAIRLPTWCVLGREVVVAPSVAQKCAISFQFYPKKDFPTGNYKRLDGLTPMQLMEICRQEEECAGFSTDGSLKRFVPRKLSQLKEMSEIKKRPLTMNDGIYVKVYPAKSDAVVNTGILTQVPVDRFGLITVVLDGTCMEEQVPVNKLFDRWKQIRIRHHHKVGKPRKPLVFGGKKLVETSDLDENDESIRNKEYDILEEGDEEEEELLRRRRRVRLQSNEEEAEDPLLDFVYEDQSTKEIRRREPHCTHTDAVERAKLIAQRRRDYETAKANEYEKKKLDSVVRLQCAWRSKRARDAFRQVLALRAKERERDKLVNAMHNANQQKKEQKQRHKTEKAVGRGFFSKWKMK